MSYPFTTAFRAELAARCQAFPRLAYEGPQLKHAAVAITLRTPATARGRRPSC